MRLWYRVPEWECFDHDGGRGVFGRHGATQDQPVGDLGPSGRESVVAMDGVLSECRWSTRMGMRGHGFRGVGTVCYLCRVYNLSIAESTVTDTSY